MASGCVNLARLNTTFTVSPGHPTGQPGLAASRAPGVTAEGKQLFPNPLCGLRTQRSHQEEGCLIGRGEQ